MCSEEGGCEEITGRLKGNETEGVGCVWVCSWV